MSISYVVRTVVFHLVVRDLRFLYQHVAQTSRIFAYTTKKIGQGQLRNSYTMGCPPVRRDNPLAFASGLSYVQVDKHGITILCHLYQCRHCTSRDI